MATPAVGVEYTSRNSIDITKMMHGARLLAMSFSMGIGNLRQISVKAETRSNESCPSSRFCGRAAKSGSAKLFLVRSAEEAQLTLEGM